MRMLLVGGLLFWIGLAIGREDGAWRECRMGWRDVDEAPEVWQRCDQRFARRQWMQLDGTGKAD